jgi:hypothetical protein
MTEKRSSSVVFFTILDLIFGLWCLFVLWETFSIPYGTGDAGEAQSWAYIFLPFPLFFVVRAILTFQRRRIARMLHMIFSIVTALALWMMLGLLLSKVINEPYYSRTCYIFLIIASALITLYFKRSTVKDQFK